MITAWSSQASGRIEVDDNSSVTVELQTIEGSKNGKLLFGGLVEKFREMKSYSGEILSIGVLEGGTNLGRPSVIILVKIDADDHENNKNSYVCCAEITGQNFLLASQHANVEISKLLRKLNPNAKDII